MRWVALFAVLGCSHGDTWTEYRSEPGRYRVEFPGTPELRDHKTVTLPTITTSYQAVLSRGRRGELQVSYYDLVVDAPVAADFAKTAEKIDCSSAAERGWTVEATREPQLGSASGYETTGTKPTSEDLPDGGLIQDRCFVIGRRMYHLTTVGPNTADQRRDSARFLDSFKTL